MITATTATAAAVAAIELKPEALLGLLAGVALMLVATARSPSSFRVRL